MVSATKSEAASAMETVKEKGRKSSPTVPDTNASGRKTAIVVTVDAVMAPAKMPAAHQTRLNTELAKILHTPDIQQKLFAQGWKVEDTAQAALAQRIQADTALYGDLIAKKGIKLD